MSAVNYDLYIEQGTTFYKKLIFKDNNGNAVDLTGYIFRGQIRKFVSSASPVLSFTCNILDQITNKGQVEISLTAEQTSSIPLDEENTAYRVVQQMCYDLERVEPSTNFVERILEGIVNISPEVTR